MEGLVVILALSAMVIAPLWRICARAGFHPALSLVALVPVLGFLILASILALIEWPAKSTGSVGADNV